MPSPWDSRSSMAQRSSPKRTVVARMPTWGMLTNQVLGDPLSVLRQSTTLTGRRSLAYGYSMLDPISDCAEYLDLAHDLLPSPRAAAARIWPPRKVGRHPELARVPFPRCPRDHPARISRGPRGRGARSARAGISASAPAGFHRRGYDGASRAAGREDAARIGVALGLVGVGPRGRVHGWLPTARPFLGCLSPTLRSHSLAVQKRTRNPGGGIGRTTGAAPGRGDLTEHIAEATIACTRSDPFEARTRRFAKRSENHRQEERWHIRRQAPVLQTAPKHRSANAHGRRARRSPHVAWSRAAAPGV